MERQVGGNKAVDPLTQNSMPLKVINDQIKISPNDILAELEASKQNNTAIGIILRDTRDLITTAVIAIKPHHSEGDFAIQLLDQDLHGYPIERTNLLLSEIERVIHFSISFDDPQYVKERRKTKFNV